MHGTRPVPRALGGGIETVIGVVIRANDGAGSFTQIDNVKGSITGIAADREGFGTYVVNPTAPLSSACSLAPAFRWRSAW